MCEIWDNFKQVNVHVMEAIRGAEKGKNPLLQLETLTPFDQTWTELAGRNQ